MIKLMFRCIGKTSKVSAKGTTWTITFIRDVGGPVLITKLATMNPDLAALYQEDKNYPIPIKEDCDLEGLFATIPVPTSSPDPPPAPEQTKSPAPANVDPETGEVIETETEIETEKESDATLFRHMACTALMETDDGRDPEMETRENVQRRRRGRPPGSKNKPKAPMPEPEPEPEPEPDPEPEPMMSGPGF